MFDSESEPVFISWLNDASKVISAVQTPRIIHQETFWGFEVVLLGSLISHREVKPSH